MKPSFIFLILLSFTTAFGQHIDKSYLDKDGQVCHPDTAVFTFGVKELGYQLI